MNRAGGGLPCPDCGGPDTSVTSSRMLRTENTRRRRRECDSCGHRFTTRERLTWPPPLQPRTST